MLFNSYIFIFLFLPVVLAGYYGFHSIKKYKLSLCWLIVMSMLFYGYDYNAVSVRYMVILMVSILLNFGLVSILSKVSVVLWRRILLLIGLFINLGILFYFKYYDFLLKISIVLLERILDFCV